MAPGQRNILLLLQEVYNAIILGLGEQGALLLNPLESTQLH
jgi:hypothetical protein